jgi:hypothetical protein
MRRLIIAIVMTIVTLELGGASSMLLAHGGGLDSCGGHNDRKHGGYHVHNHAAYCRCNPSATGCKSESSDAEDKPKPPLKSGTAESPSLEGLMARIAALEARVTELERARASR